MISCDNNDCMAVRQYYTLEKHLECCAKVSDAGKYLCSKWFVDKQELIKKLANTNITYPGFSSHDATHSEQIIGAIEKILGEERIKKLSATDAWLILECAYSHDIAMLYTPKDLMDKWKSDIGAFNNWIITQVVPNRFLYKELAVVYPLLKIIFNGELINLPIAYDDNDDDLTEEQACLPTRITAALTSLAQAYMRPTHAADSRTVMYGEIETDKDSIIPVRLKQLVGDINAFHGDDMENLLKCFPHITRGLGHDNAHPRFIALLICLGDLLDIDSDRFSRYQILVVGHLDEYSVVNQLKHNAVTRLDIRPQQVEVETTFSDKKTKNYLENLPLYWKLTTNKTSINELQAEAIKTMLKWLKWLKDDLEYLSKYWTSIAPLDFPGSVPSFKSRVCLENDFNHKITELTLDEVDLRYEIDSKRASSLIEGSNMYKQPALVFLRELIQNATDSSKIRLNNEINRGRFIQNPLNRTWCRDPMTLLSLLGQTLMEFRIEVEVKVEGIKQDEDNNDINLDSSNNFDCIKKKQKNKTQEPIIVITVRDYGTGISFEQLKDMRNIGNTSNPELVRLQTTSRYMHSSKAGMPAWLAPTGSFGLGMQSIFRNVNQFEIITVYRGVDGVEGRRATFHSARFGVEIYTQQMRDVCMDKFGQGTEIIIKLNTNASKRFIKNASIDENHGRHAGYHDEFSIRAEQIHKCIHDYIVNYCDSVFFPVVVKFNSEITYQRFLGKPKSEGLDGYWSNIFGECIIYKDLGEKIVKYSLINTESDLPIIKHVDVFPDIKSAFSYWYGDNNDICGDSSTGILIKYYLPNIEDEPQTRVYFKGIRVMDEYFEENVQLPNISVDIHLMGLITYEYLMVNRDRFLPDKVFDLSSLIQRINIQCFDVIIRATNNIGICEGIIPVIHKVMAFTNIYPLHICCDRLYSEYRMCVFYREENTYYITTQIKDGMTPTKEQLFFIEDIGSWDNNDLAYCSTGIDDYIEVMEDIWTHYYHQIAISEFRLFSIHKLMNFKKERLLNSFYKLNIRSSDTVIMGVEDYWQYIVNITNIKTSANSLTREVYPGVDEYRSIAVRQVPLALLESHNRRFMSWTISPFSAEKLNTTMRKVNERYKSIDLFEQRRNLLQEELKSFFYTLEGERLITWVSDNSIERDKCKNVSKDLVIDLYFRWIDEFVKRYIT